MKRFDIEKITINQVLTGIAIFLAFMIVLSTILGLAKKNSKNLKIAKNPSIVIAQGQDTLSAEYYSFKNFERMRIVPKETKNANPTTLIITPCFAYTKDDKDFNEELSRKSSIIKSSIVNYFSSKTVQELNALGEENVKEQLKKQINENLVLNKIQGIYFSEYIFLQ